MRIMSHVAWGIKPRWQFRHLDAAAGFAWDENINGMKITTKYSDKVGGDTTKHRSRNKCRISRNALASGSANRGLAPNAAYFRVLEQGRQDRHRFC
jgi:hypothetical protein